MVRGTQAAVLRTLLSRSGSKLIATNRYPSHPASPEPSWLDLSPVRVAPLSLPPSAQIPPRILAARPIRSAWLTGERCLGSAAQRHAGTPLGIPAQPISSVSVRDLRFYLPLQAHPRHAARSIALPKRCTPGRRLPASPCSLHRRVLPSEPSV